MLWLLSSFEQYYVAQLAVILLLLPALVYVRLQHLGANSSSLLAHARPRKLNGSEIHQSSRPYWLLFVGCKFQSSEKQDMV